MIRRLPYTNRYGVRYGAYRTPTRITWGYASSNCQHVGYSAYRTPTANM